MLDLKIVYNWLELYPMEWPLVNGFTMPHFLGLGKIPRDV